MIVLAIASPIILIIGLLGNLVSFIIFNNEKMRNLPTFRFLAYLSLIDCLYILTGIPHLMSMSFIDFDFRNSSNFLCSFHSFLTIFLSHLSSNVLAAVGVLRCTELTSMKPAKKLNLINKKHRTKMNKNDSNISYSANESKNLFKFGKVEIILLLIMFILFLLDSHYLFFMRLTLDQFQNYSNETTLKYICYPSTLESNQTLYYEFYSILWPWIDLFLYSYIPFTVMMTSTIIIILKLFKANNNLKRKFETKSLLNADQKKEIRRIEERNKNDNKIIFEAAKRRIKRNNQVYKLLITLNVTFFILVTPLVFCNSIKLLDTINQTLVEVIYLLAYLNHCLNFIFFGLTCEQFRIILFKKLHIVSGLS
jgi:hypothetical protein